MVSPLTVVGLTVSLKVKTIFVWTAAPVAPLAGATDVTDGGVVSAPPAVPKEDWNSKGRLAPARSVIPHASTKCGADGAKPPAGVNVALRPSTATVTLPAIGKRGPPVDTNASLNTLNVDAVTVNGFIR